jgi:hypothetical protein
MGNVSLDNYFNDKEINFIKADIEGAEVDMLNGSKSLLENKKDLTLLLCTYHKHSDGIVIKNLLENKGFKTEYSNGYMLFIYDHLEPPFFRRALIRAKRKNQ